MPFKGRQNCLQVWSNALLENILIHCLINFLSYVYIAAWWSSSTRGCQINNSRTSIVSNFLYPFSNMWDGARQISKFCFGKLSSNLLKPKCYLCSYRTFCLFVLSTRLLSIHRSIWSYIQGFPNSGREWWETEILLGGNFLTGWKEPEEEWFWQFEPFSKLKTAFREYWTSIKIKINMT